MEKFVAVFAVLAALLAANVSVSEAQTVETYFKVGGELRLSPQKVSGSIFSIVWKYDKNLLAEWVKGSIELIYYSKFNGRSELNTVTGDLVVRNMTSGDKGVYSVEINNQVQSRVYQTVEIQDVPKPEAHLQPLACKSDSTSCKLICSGVLTNAGPVTYSWQRDEGEWIESQSNPTEILNNEETWPVKTFSCRMKNPVSNKTSDPINNPFYQEKKPAESSSTGTTVGVIIGVLAAVGFLTGLGIWKRKTIKEKLPCIKRNVADPSSSENKPENTELLNKGNKASLTGDNGGHPQVIADSNVIEVSSSNDNKGEDGVKSEVNQP